MNIIITGRGMKVTEPLKKKIKKMLKKHETFVEKATKLQVELKQRIAHSGVENDLKIEFTITMPNSTIIRVEEKGSDMYALVDKIDPILRRRLIRYHDALRKWEGEESWKVIEEESFEQELKKVNADVYADDVEVTPIITRYKQYSQNSPMHPAEAIERMELLGHKAFLFKNIENENKYSMVYKRDDGTYGLVEPRDG